MNSNGRSHVDEQRVYKYPGFEQPKPQPLVPAEPVMSDLDKKLAAKEKQLELKLMGFSGAIAAMDRARPLIDAVIGDPNATLATLGQVILQRGVDIAEDVIEITISDEE